MTDTVQQAAPARTDSGMISWRSTPSRIVTIYLPLACFVFVLLFPFYWMTITTLKPNVELYNYHGCFVLPSLSAQYPPPASW